MTVEKDARKQNARSVIEEIFAHPPVSEAELRQRLMPVDAKVGRSLLMERLSRALVGEEEFGLFLEVFSKLGVGEERRRLAAIVNNGEYDTLTRTLAMTLLAEDDPDYLSADIEGIDPEDFSKLADRPLIELMNSVEVAPDTAAAVTVFLRESPEEIREFLLDRLGCCRRDAGVSAVAAYSDALGCAELEALHDAMLESVAEEGCPEAAALLEELRDAAVDPRTRRRFQKALLKLNTRAIEPGHDERRPEGAAYLASCDGQGAFVLLGFFRKPNGSSITANLCIQAASDVRDGFVIPRHSQRELRAMMQQVREGTGCEFAPISLSEAATMVTEAVERTRAQGLAIPGDARSAVKLFQRASRVAGSDEPSSGRKRGPSLSRMRELLDRPTYAHWFFDTGDLVSAGVELPGREKQERSRWIASAARKLDLPPIKNRVTAMARHMARWHGYRDETSLAALCSAAARATERNFSRSTLVRAMLERTLQTARQEPDDEVKVFGAPAVRQFLKSLFFQDLKCPRGSHLALLDFTEVALTCLDDALAAVPGERRPRDESKARMAFSIARCYRNLVRDERGRSVDSHMRSMANSLSRVCRLTRKECLEVGAVVAFELNLFVDEVCSKCPVSCLDSPRAHMAEVFFSPYHPVEAACAGKEHGDVEETG
jgi:hypothetical protein